LVVEVRAQILLVDVSAAVEETVSLQGVTDLVQTIRAAKPQTQAQSGPRVAMGPGPCPFLSVWSLSTPSAPLLNSGSLIHCGYRTHSREVILHSITPKHVLICISVNNTVLAASFQRYQPPRLSLHVTALQPSFASVPDDKLAATMMTLAVPELRPANYVNAQLCVCI
jgi:hypothetical protein